MHTPGVGLQRVVDLPVAMNNAAWSKRFISRTKETAAL